MAPDKGKQYDVVIDGEFNEENMSKWVQDAQAAAADHPRVLVKFTSPGGEVYTLLKTVQALEDVKKNHPGAKLVCYGDVIVASAAIATFEAVCDERYVSPETLVLFHEVQGPIGGPTEAQAAEVVDQIHIVNIMLDQFIARRLGLSLEEYRVKVYGHNWWLSADGLVIAHGADAVVAREDLPAQKEPKKKKVAEDEK